MQKDLSKDQERQLSGALKQAKADAQRKLRSMQDVWCSNLVAEMQAAADMKSSKELYNLTKQAFGPKTARVTPLRSKDGKEVHNTMEKISNRWKEHFSELLNRKSQVDPAALERIQQRPKVGSLNDLPTLEEVQTSISKLNLGKAAGKDGLFSEICRFGGDHTAVVMHAVISNVWEKGEVPKDWRDAIMIPLYKGKGQVKAKCGGTTEALLFCRQLERYWQVYFYHDSMPKSRKQFYQSRSADSVKIEVQVTWFWRHAKYKRSALNSGKACTKVFVDLTKAFDSVNRETLWKILGKLGCPDHFVKLIRSFHEEMEVSVNVGDILTDPFKVETGVKQGDWLAPTLVYVFFSIVLNDAFRDCNQGIYIRYRNSGKLFNIHRFAAKTKVLLGLVRDLLYADGCDLVAHTESDMQCFMDRLSEACKAFGLTISLDKTVVMLQPALGTVYVEPFIYTDGKKLKAGTAKLLWKWWGWQVTQSGREKNTFFLVTLYNFQKSGRAIALTAPPSPRSLEVCWQVYLPGQHH